MNRTPHRIARIAAMMLLGAVAAADSRADGYPTFSDSDWYSIGANADGYIGPLVVSDSGVVYVGGGFTNVGGVAANRVARWDGANWTNLAAGLNGDVYALALDASNQLYAAGDFSAAGGVPATNIARWNGANWTNLGTGFDAPVFALAVDGAGQLYAGGAFSNAGGVAAVRVARWNGSAWSSFGSGINNDVRALALDRATNLYAGGFFTGAGDVGASRIAMWNGSAWTNLGVGMNDNVLALAVHRSGLLFAGGAFTTAGGFSAARLAAWNGFSWGPVGDANDVVSALAADHVGSLYVGGVFTNIGGIAANRIAVWNANNWAALGSGMNGPVFALAVDQPGNLYAGGTFTTAGATPAALLARADVHAISAWSLDEAGNYPASPFFVNGANRGYGFDPWLMAFGLGATATLADSTEATGSINSTNGLSFKLYGGPGGTYADAVRPFYLPLASGDVFEVTIAYNWNGGNRGVSFMNFFGQELLFVNFGSNDVLTAGWANGSPITLSSTYVSTATLNVAITQLSSNRLSAHILRNDGFSTNLISDPFPAFDGTSLKIVKFYNGGHPADNSNYALYANDLIIRRNGTRPRFMDSDGDGMANDWEVANGLNAAVPNGVAGNADGDERTDFEEYIADTSPTNPASVFQPVALGAAPAGSLALIIAPTSTARVYAVEGATDLLASPQVWTMIVSNIAGNGGALTIPVTNDTPLRHYRTGVSRPVP